MVLREEEIGEVGPGSSVLFPGISSCTAVVISTEENMIGAHFTEDRWGDAGPANYTRNLIDHLILQLNNRSIDRLMIVGFNKNHNPKKIAEELGIQEGGSWDAYDISRKDVSDIALIFRNLGSKTRAKVKIVENPAPNDYNFGHPQGPQKYSGTIAVTVEVGESIATLRKHFVECKV